MRFDCPQRYEPGDRSKDHRIISHESLPFTNHTSCKCQRSNGEDVQSDDPSNEEENYHFNHIGEDDYSNE